MCTWKWRVCFHLFQHVNINIILPTEGHSTVICFPTLIIMFHRPETQYTTSTLSHEDQPEHVFWRLPYVIHYSLAACAPGVAPVCWHASRLLPRHTLPPASCLAAPTQTLHTDTSPLAPPSSPKCDTVSAAAEDKPVRSAQTIQPVHSKMHSLQGWVNQPVSVFSLLSLKLMQHCSLICFHPPTKLGFLSIWEL